MSLRLPPLFMSWSQRLLTALLLGVLAFAIFGPIANMLLWAVTEVWYFPHKLPLEYGFSFWERVFRPQGNAMESLLNSILIALLTVLASLAVSIPAGYALGKGRLPWRSLFLLLFLLPQAFPTLAVHANIARVFYSIGLNGTITGVVLVHTIQGLVLAVWISAAAFAAVDEELEQAARNIGASPFRTFLTITLPLAAPGILAGGGTADQAVRLRTVHAHGASVLRAAGIRTSAPAPSPRSEAARMTALDPLAGRASAALLATA